MRRLGSTYQHCTAGLMTSVRKATWRDYMGHLISKPLLRLQGQYQILYVPPKIWFMITLSVSFDEQANVQIVRASDTEPFVRQSTNALVAGCTR
jgi:hypothetical protein